MPNFIKLDTITVNGMINLGKQTFPKMEALVLKTLDTDTKQVEK